MMLEGKIILVAGAAGLLGRALVQAICKEGGRAIAADVNEVALVNWLKDSGLSGDQVKTTSLDICDCESIKSSLNFAHEAWGQIDGAVNSSYPRNKNYGKKFFDVSYKDFSENLSLHLGGYFLFMQQCARYAKANDLSFSLVNLSSIYGVIAPKFDVYEGTEMTMPVEYAAIKAALLHLNTYTTAVMKGTRFRVNSVSPGGIENGQPKEFLLRYKEHSRGKGMLDAGDVTGAVQFLLSDQSQFICGQNIIVDDGFSI
jgi:NAD(P)-dependent dehydrogenase (short-subunit alcohol dehydrogenase family)